MPTVEPIFAEDAYIAPIGTFVPPGAQEGGRDAPSFADAGNTAEFPMDLKFGALPDRRLRFKQPLNVRLYKDNGTYIAQCVEIEQFGYGGDSSEALDDLGKTLSEMYFYLSDAGQSGTLGESLAAQYSLLCEFVGPRHG